ncbi:hypothetical protein [Rhodoferax sp.]|uniref:hypothetical protein n=1 Tax=Rhodoferax sp. TaxID=50421 RepID=UPI002752C4D9|nr:hypothetical protein [Rhodoferax sp.]
MSTAAKRPTTVKSSATALSAAKTGAATATRTATRTAAKAVAKTAEPSLRFYHSKALRTKTNVVLDAIETAPGHPKQGDAVAQLVSELVEAGMDYYFLRALKLADVGFVTEQSARLGMSGAVRLISSISAKFIGRMDQAQLLVVVRHIRSLA